MKFWYKTHNQELLEIVQSFHTWYHFLKGSAHTVLVMTDHNNLKYFQITKTLTCWQTQWSLELAVFDFNIVYKVSKHNAADVPSKQPDYASEVEENSCLPML